MDDTPIEQDIEHSRGEQNTGNHRKPGVHDPATPDKAGGKRTGAEGHEPAQSD